MMRINHAFTLFNNHYPTKNSELALGGGGQFVQ